MTLVQDAPFRASLAPARPAWRNLLVHVQPEAEARPRLQAAADLARRLDARLTGVGAELVQPTTDPIAMAGVELMPALLEALQTDLDLAKAAFEAETRSMDARWLSIVDFPDAAMTREACAADLVIAGGSPLKAHDEYRWCDPAQLAIKCGRPVLVVPPEGGSLTARSAVVAWKGTREARRALADSLPLLKCAREVVVAAVSGEPDLADAQAETGCVVDYLVLHGVRARPKVRKGDSYDVVPELQDEADAIGADLIVAGAYGHTRIGEWIMSGVTRELLRDPRRFLLLSH